MKENDISIQSIIKGVRGVPCSCPHLILHPNSFEFLSGVCDESKHTQEIVEVLLDVKGENDWGQKREEFLYVDIEGKKGSSYVYLVASFFYFLERQGRSNKPDHSWTFDTEKNGALGQKKNRSEEFQVGPSENLSLMLLSWTDFPVT